MSLLPLFSAPEKRGTKDNRIFFRKKIVLLSKCIIFAKTIVSITLLILIF
jgi:hypothetical protein